MPPAESDFLHDAVWPRVTSFNWTTGLTSQIPVMHKLYIYCYGMAAILLAAAYNSIHSHIRGGFKKFQKRGDSKFSNFREFKLGNLYLPAFQWCKGIILVYVPEVYRCFSKGTRLVGWGGIFTSSKWWDGEYSKLTWLKCNTLMVTHCRAKCKVHTSVWWLRKLKQTDEERSAYSMGMGVSELCFGLVCSVSETVFSMVTF